MDEAIDRITADAAGNQAPATHQHRPHPLGGKPQGAETTEAEKPAGPAASTPVPPPKAAAQADVIEKPATKSKPRSPVSAADYSQIRQTPCIMRDHFARGKPALPGQILLTTY